ncbi:MAG: hypothetical protein A4E61_01544 [Syntrophorhabdus sp. PtaB.Bin184]|jgi:uncharacterized membrane protein (UPF0182 family)|nr:MAG: hypothetical protein A4E61_01544 [Syntrophorhabdus sp. PtaB.Bin184]
MVKNRKRFILIASILVFIAIFSRLLGTYVDWLFFVETGYSFVFTRVISMELLSGLCFGAFAFFFVFINIRLINRLEFPTPAISINGYATFTLNPTRLAGLSRLLGLLVSLFIGILGALWGASLWDQILFFFNGVSTGLSDPVFGKDVGFYLFRLPLYQSLSSFLGFILFLSLMISIVAYTIKRGFHINRFQLFIAKEIRIHLGVLASLVLLKTAFGFYLDKFDLLYTSRQIITGAGYADVHAKLFVLNLLVVLSVIAGIAFILAFAKSRFKAAFYPVGAVIAVYIIGMVIYPNLLQNFKVTPNELDLERPFIQHHIEFTRYGYGLGKIDLKPFNVSYDLTVKEIQKNDGTIRNIRLWDEGPLLKTLSQLQQIRTYYKFTSIENDRYRIDGKYLQVMASARELSYDDLPSKSWINEKLVFTHGNGVSLAHVARITPEGLPEFIVKDIPPTSITKDIKVSTPEIYFGELTRSYAIANTRIPEFSYPTSEGNVYSSYKGSGGVAFDSFFKRLVFATHFKDAKILLSSDIRADSRILYFRNITERIRKATPFLSLDQDPYIVISGSGKLYWMVDAYTVSTHLPYSRRLRNRVNYMRNSVKITVDAYNGTIKYYLSDPDDPIAKAYSTMFPGLFQDFDAMPEDLRKHVRYPRDLFKTQASLYATYHMSDPKTFYNKEDLWEIPSHAEKSMEPYYLIMKLPGEKGEEYVLLAPYTPAKRDNLAAWFAARCDTPNYGKLIVYTFPRDRLVYGPRQIDARIDQDSYISQQLTLWGQRGSQVIRGSLLIIPVESALMYIQPLYLAAEDKGGLPELRRIIVAYENNVVMDETLEGALQKIFGGRAPAPTPIQTGAIFRPTGVKELAGEAARTFERMMQLQRQGDWAGYGEQMKKLERLLKDMTKE